MVNASGVYELTMDEYHADPCETPSLSRGVIKDILFKSPKHAWFNHPRLNIDFVQDDGSGRFDFGTSAHDMLLLGKKSFVIVEADDWRTKAAKEKREEAKKEGKIALLRDQSIGVCEMTAEAMKQIRACKELGIEFMETEGDSEQSYIWSEEVWMRARPDWISKDKRLIIDYKTTETSANPDDYARIIISNGLDIQAAMYSRGVRAIEQTDPTFVFVVQEIKPPYLCSFISLSRQFMEMGIQKVEYAKFLFQKCLETNDWPAYPMRICHLEPPAWAITSWESRAQEVGI